MSREGYRPDGSHLAVNAVFWDRLATRDPATVAELSGFEAVAPETLQFRFLNAAVRVDIAGRCLRKAADGRWPQAHDPLLEMVSVIYLGNVSAVHPVGRDMVGLGDLKERHFFVGPHALELGPLLTRFGRDAAAFRAACETLGGSPVPLADAAYRLMPFPRVAMDYLLWEGDAEFAPEIRVLHDRLIETVLQADAIWALTNRVSQALAAA